MDGLLFSRNSIYDNDSLGIQTVDNSFTYASPVIPAPTIDSVVYQPGQFIYYGKLISSPNTQYTIEYFSSLTPDPSGYGEGETFLFSQIVTTDNAGFVAYSASSNQNIGGQYISSTATDFFMRNTSRFSNIPPLAFVGINEQKFDGSLLFYPDPVQDYLEIASDRIPVGKTVEVEVRDLEGRLIMQESIIASGRLVVSAANLTPGLYFCAVQVGMLHFTGKFVKQ
jgi:hypothetical protein